jgi:precorrin-6B methylase 1
LFAKVNDSWYKVWFEAALIHGFCDNREECLTRLEKLKEKFSKPEDNQFYDANRPGKLAEFLSNDGFSRDILFILSQLEMTDQFH